MTDQTAAPVRPAGPATRCPPRFRVGQTVIGAMGRLAIHAAWDTRQDSGALIALAMPAGGLPRRSAWGALRGEWVPGLALPLGVVPGGSGEGWMICRAPPGPSLDRTMAAGGAIGERALLLRVLRPVARMLARLHAIGVTHRAICPATLFSAGADQPVVLGCGWAAPPGMLLPPGYACLTRADAGWMEGTGADDVFALGVTLLALWCGHAPRPGVDAAELLRARRAQGSLVALTGTATLPATLHRLLALMLDDVPDRRPSAEALCDPCALLDDPPLLRRPEPPRAGWRFGGTAEAVLPGGLLF